MQHSEDDVSVANNTRDVVADCNRNSLNSHSNSRNEPSCQQVLRNLTYKKNILEYVLG